MNSLYNDFNKAPGNFGNIVSEFNRFKASLGNINPRDEVMRALQSGRISQSQLNQAQSMANQLSRFLK